MNEKLHIELEAEKMIDTLLDEKSESGFTTEQDIIKSLEKPQPILHQPVTEPNFKPTLKPPLPPLPENVTDVASLEAELLKTIKPITKKEQPTDKQEPKVDETKSPVMNIFKQQFPMPQQMYQPNIFNMMAPRGIPPYDQQRQMPPQHYMNPYQQYQAHQQYLMQQQLMMNMQRQRMQQPSQNKQKQPTTQPTTQQTTQPTTPQKKPATTPKSKSKLIPSQLLVKGVTPKKKKETIQPLDSDKDFPPLNSAPAPKPTQQQGGISQWFPDSQSAFPPFTQQSPTIPSDAKIFSVDEIEKQVTSMINSKS